MKQFKKYLEIIQEMNNIKDMNIQELLLSNVAIGGNENESNMVKYYQSIENFIKSEDILNRQNYKRDSFAGMIFRFIIKENDRYYYFRLQSDMPNIYEDDIKKEDNFSDRLMLSGFSISEELKKALLYIEDIEPIILISTQKGRENYSFKQIEETIKKKINDKSIDKDMIQKEKEYLSSLTPERIKILKSL